MLSDLLCIMNANDVDILNTTDCMELGNALLTKELEKDGMYDLMKTFKIPTTEEAALWSFRPGWYQKYGGDINKIPEDAKGSFGKSGKQVMLQRQISLQQYLEKVKNAAGTPNITK